MNPPPVITQFANPDPNAAPLTVTQLVQLLNSLVNSQIQGSYLPYIISADTPGADDHDKAWIKLDAQGKPISIMIWYNGNWRRIYNGMLGEIRGYTGNPATDFESDGTGKVGGNYDGWHICNGQGGSPNLTDKFLVGAHMDNSGGHTGYANGHWQTFVDGMSDLQTGGAANFQLDAAHTYYPGRPAVEAHLWSANGNVPTTNGDLYGVFNSGTNTGTLLAGDAANTSPTAIPTLPPFYALAWIVFIGY